MKFRKIFGCDCCFRCCHSCCPVRPVREYKRYHSNHRSFAAQILVFVLSATLISALAWICFHNLKYFSVTNNYGDRDDDGDHGTDSEELVVPFKINEHSLNDAADCDNKFRTESNFNNQPFRSVTDQFWDPHPIYVLDAFGHEFIFDLRQQFDLAIPDFIDHVFENGTQYIQQIGLKSRCFYEGKVRYDPDSYVMVSLCDGMQGFIRAWNQSFYIKPVDKNSCRNICDHLHRVRKDDLFESNDTSAKTLDHYWDSQTKLLDEKNRDWIDRISRQAALNTSDAPQQEEHQNGRSRRDIYLDHTKYVIELLLVVDHHLIQMHNDSDEELVRYILTLIGHAQSILKDPTIGNPVTIALVKIVVQKFNVFQLPDDYNRGTSSVELREKFCDWQHSTYSNRLEYDAAIFLTKNVICTEQNGLMCLTLGIAELGTMCTPKRNCAVVKDTGLATSYTIAHEIGHLLGMIHDNDNVCGSHTNAMLKPDVFLMNAMFKNSIKYWKWSKCSRWFLTEFLRSSGSWCLTNEPSKNLLATETERTHLPGEYFNNNRQCEILFGSNYEICPYMKDCSVLFCRKRGQKDVGCLSHNTPMADGTRCEPNKWCYHSKCVELNRDNIAPVDGGWSDWKEYSDCSLACGGGVQESKRTCDAPEPKNGGSFCIGHSIRYQSCNSHNCPPSAPDMRDILCSQYNGNTMGIQNLNSSVRWEPKYGVAREDSCKLHCKIVGSYEYHMLNLKVRDGVKCDRDTYDICVGGVCQSAGCDNVLKSTARFDQCGVCKGNNKNCDTIKKSYNISTKYGYTDIFTIKKGSTNIDIRQTSRNQTNYDTAYLALKDTRTGNYVLNGNYIISGHSKQFVFGGLKFEYTGGFKVLERVYALTQNKSITEDLTFGILAIDDSVVANVASSFQITREPKKFFWKPGVNFCRDICIHGSSQDLKCVNDVRLIGTSSDCGPVNMDELRKYCQQNKCFSWRYGNFGKCLCTGTQALQIECVNLMQDSRVVSRENCADQKPPNQIYRNCSTPISDCYKWSVGEWSGCDAQCGPGQRHRLVQCQQSYTNVTVADPFCFAVANTSLKSRPASNQSCTGYDCHVAQRFKKIRPKLVFHWHFGNWGQCSKKCAGGRKQRFVQCRNMYGKTVDKTDCLNAGLQQPQSIAECNEHECPQWQFGDWTPCDSACKQFRYVVCRNQTHAKLPDADCETATKNAKPNARRDCESCVLQTVRFQWRDARWSNCSTNCGYGFRRRYVYCHDSKTDRRTDYAKCDHNKKPKEFRRCQLKPCRGPKRAPVDQTVCSCNIGPWGACERAKMQAKYTQRRLISCHDRDSGKSITWKVCRKQEMYKKTKKRRRCYRSCKELKTDRKIDQNGEHFLYLMNATKKARIFCAKMNTIEPTEFISLIGGDGGADDNYSEFYDLRWNASEAASCELNRSCLMTHQCIRDTEIRSGKTIFSKIRLNVTSMHVIPDDFTYSFQKYGKEQTPFAHAGDCFVARADCAHGQFRINFRSTNFRLASDVTWTAIGSFSSVQVQILDRQQRQVVHGRCGGYCGKCRPNKLRLEIF